MRLCRDRLVFLTKGSLPCAPAGQRRGVVFLSVMVVVAILALAAYHFVALTSAQLHASAGAVRAAQNRAVADSGVHYVAALLSTPDNILNYLDGNPFSNPDRFRNIKVPGVKDGYFSILAPPDANDADGSARRYGVTDEHSKINLNAYMIRDPKGELLYNALLKLPYMDEKIANRIVDWIDPDSDTRPDGAESDHYASKNYRCKNGPLDSLDELLLVDGVTPELLYGGDANRNGIIDEDEDAGLGLGWQAFLTVFSRDQNINAAGLPLLDINGKDMAKLYDEIEKAVSEDMAKYIALYRKYGPTNTTKAFAFSADGKTLVASPAPKLTVSGNLADLRRDQIDMKGSNKINSLFDLVKTQVSVPAKNQKDPALLYSCPLNDVTQQRALLPKLFETVSAKADAEVPARININTAPKEVLQSLKGLGDTDVQNILSRRPRPSAGAPDAIFQTPAWLLTEVGIKLETLKQLEPYITTLSQTYRVHVVGMVGDKGPVARIEAVIDTGARDSETYAGRPRIVYWRDLSESGMGNMAP